MEVPGTISAASEFSEDITSSYRTQGIVQLPQKGQQNTNENYLFQLENSRVYINRTKSRKKVSDNRSIFTSESRHTGRWSTLTYLSTSQISVINLPILIRGLLDSKGKESKDIPNINREPTLASVERSSRITNINNNNIIRTVLASVDVGKERGLFECMVDNKDNELRWSCSLLIIHNRAQFEWKNLTWADVAIQITTALRSWPEPRFFEPDTAKLALRRFSTNVILHRNYFDRKAKLPPLTVDSKMRVSHDFVEAVMGCLHRIPGVFHEFEDQSFPFGMFPEKGISGKDYATNVKLREEGMKPGVKYQHLSKISLFMWTSNVIELVLEFDETKLDLEVTVVCPETHFMRMARRWEINDLAMRRG